MQFNHPEVLFALFLLIIPVIVHLFQLRRFRKESFTNVKFLKKLTQQSRKSSRLKKWLVLATRLLLLTCIILAFAGPFFPSEKNNTREIETLIYLDNSYSMQAMGQRGRLLERIIQELLEQLPEDHTISLITNNEELFEVSRQDLQEIDYSPTPEDLNTVLLKAENIFSADSLSNRKLLLISNFQDDFRIPPSLLASGIEIYALPLRPERLENINIDSIFHQIKTVGSSVLRVKLSYTGANPGTAPVSIYNANELLGKSSVDFSNGNVQELEFPLENIIIPEGRIVVEDNGLPFDNSFFFSVEATQPIKISSISSATDNFLKKIFTSPEFELNPMTANAIDYNALSSAQVVILNELEDLPNSLSGTLSSLANEEVIFIVIPPTDGIGAGLKSFIRELGFKGTGSIIPQEKLVTGISFNHPLYSGVFEEQIRNFEYPKVQVSYELFSGDNSILSFEDNRSFLVEAEGNFLFAGALNSENSNFKQSPLIVPSFYNMGISALQPNRLFYILGEENKIEVPVSITGDRILKISSANTGFIPQQRVFPNKVELITEEFPNEPGNYQIINKDEIAGNISFNVNREESSFVFTDISEIDNITVVKDLSTFFTTAGFTKEIDTLWKWFVTFALIFLLIETLLLKYFK